MGRSTWRIYLLAKGAVCDPLSGPPPPVTKRPLAESITGGKANFETLRPLCEIAAACGHFDAFVQVDDAIRKLVSVSDWHAPPGSRLG